MVENISDAVTTLAGYIALIEFIIKMIKALRRRLKPKNSKKRRKRKGKH